MTPQESADQYAELMTIVRLRLDLISSIRNSSGEPFVRAEVVAFHLRKVIEGIAFGCLTATHSGLKQVPRDAKGKWKADSILAGLKKKGIEAFPSPSILRKPTDAEQAQHGNIKLVVEGIPERRLTHEELIHLYRDTHKWLHELNPYLRRGRNSFLKNYEAQLWSAAERVDKFIDRHAIAIKGEGFLCVLRDKVDDQTKVSLFSKPTSPI